jgi:hypothetical protein
MSFSQPKTSAGKKTAMGGVKGSQISGTMHGPPVPWGLGIFRVPGACITPLFSTDFYHKPSGGYYHHDTKTFGTIEMVFCHGPIELNQADITLWYNGEADNITNWAASTRYADFKTPWLHPEGTVRLHKGVMDKVLADRLLKYAVPNDPYSVYWDSPLHLGVVVGEFHHIKIKERYGGNSLPNIEMTFRRRPQRPGGMTGLDQTVFETLYSNGVNPVAAGVQFLSDKAGGFGRRVGGYDQARMNALMLELQGESFALSPLLDEQIEERKFISTLLEYFDGFPILEDGILSFGRIPPGGASPDPAEITELSEHDWVGQPEISDPSDEATVNEVEVVYSDRSRREMAESSVVRFARRNRRKVGEPKRAPTLKRPWFTTADQATGYGDVYLQSAAYPQMTIKGSVRRNRAVNPDGSRLRVGDLVQVDYAPRALDLLCRVWKRTDSYKTPGAVKLELRQERGAYPQIYIAPADLLPDLTLPDVNDLANGAMAELPWDFGGRGALQVAALWEPGVDNRAVDLWYGGADGSSYDNLGRALEPALKGTFDANVTSGATSFAITLPEGTGYLPGAITALMSANDEVLLLADFSGVCEVMSVASISATGGGHYDLTVLRGRQTSIARAHTSGAACWLIERSKLTTFAHQSFTGVVTQYFKIQPMNAFQGLTLAAITAITMTLNPPSASAAFAAGSPASEATLVKGEKYSLVIDLTSAPPTRPCDVYVKAYYFASDDDEALGAVIQEQDVFAKENWIQAVEGSVTTDWVPNFLDKTKDFNWCWLVIWTWNGISWDEGTERGVWLVEPPQVSAVDVTAEGYLTAVVTWTKPTPADDTRYTWAYVSAWLASESRDKGMSQWVYATADAQARFTFARVGTYKFDVILFAADGEYGTPYPSGGEELTLAMDVPTIDSVGQASALGGTAKDITLTITVPGYAVGVQADQYMSSWIGFNAQTANVLAWSRLGNIYTITRRVTSGGTYKYRVYCQDGTGNSSAASAEETVVVVIGA